MVGDLLKVTEVGYFSGDESEFNKLFRIFSDGNRVLVARVNRGERYARALQHQNSEMARFRAMPDVREIDHLDLVEFVNKPRGAVILVTKEGHPAHPAMVLRQAIEENGQLFMKMSSTGAGDQEALKVWVDHMAAEDKKAADQKKQNR
jgi:hypothetical protein